jgi:glycosyltransferase involved in cell wall biosynthesis
MPRVVHVTQPTDGGVAAYVARVATDQADRGWQVTVICPDGEPLQPDLAAAGVVRLPWPATRSPGPHTVREVASLRSHLRSVSADLVHLHSSKAGLAGRLVLRGRVPTLFQPHGWSWLAVDGVTEAASARWERLAARWADRLVCVSEAEEAAGLSAGVRGSFAVVRNGVDTSRFAPRSAAQRARARQALALEPGPLVVCVGRLARQKGQDLLLSAWPAVRRQVPDVRLALVGGGTLPDGPPLADFSGVLAVGHQSDVRDWLAAGDVVVFPSRWEGLSLGLLEAAAIGSSIVATDVAGAREVLGADRGAVVALDPGAIEAAIIARLRQPALVATERRAVAAYVAAHMDERQTLQRLADLVEDVVAERGR